MAFLYSNVVTCVSAFVEILQSLHCKIFKYTFLGQYQMKPWDFFFLCKIQPPAWLQLAHKKLGPPGMRLFRPLYPQTEKKHSFKCDLLLWKTLIRVSIEFQTYHNRFDNKYFYLQTSKTFVQVETNKVLHELGVEDRHLVASFETLWLQEADLKG